jgi:hypothetical protein
MPGQPFQWQDQPEAAGPLSEYGAANGGAALDIQALRQGSVRLPQLNEQALADGDYVPRSGPDPYHDIDRINRERAELYQRDSLTLEIAQAARKGVRDAITARNITAAAIEDADATARAVAADELAAKEAAK